MKVRNQLKKASCFFSYLMIAGTLFAPSAASAADYYVSPTGNDANSGTQASPYKTIKHVLNNVLEAGDTAFLRGGVYNEKLESHTGTTFPSGTSWSNPVTIKAFSGETPILKGVIAIGIQTPYTQYLIFDGIVIDAEGYRGAVGINGGANHIRFINGEVKNADAMGFSITYSNVVELGSVPTYLEFINMDIHHNGTRVNNDHGMYIKTSNNLIEKCKIHDNSAWGIHQYVYPEPPHPDSNNNIIRNNEFWGNGVVGGSGGGIVMGSGSGNLAYNNLIYDNQNGIQVTGGNTPTDNLVYHNTVFSNNGFGIKANFKSIDTLITNNIVYQNGTAIEDLGTGTVITNYLTTNPSFVDGPGGDFHLQSDSPSIDTGTTLQEVATDFDGIERPQGSFPDMGAFEYIQTPDDVSPSPPKNFNLIIKHPVAN